MLQLGKLEPDLRPISNKLADAEAFKHNLRTVNTQ